MSNLVLLDLLEPLPADELADERSFRTWQNFREKLGPVAGEIERLVGFLRVAPASYFGGCRFDVGIRDADADLSIIVGALGEREALVDAVAWPIDRPERWATLSGRLPALGWTNLIEHPAKPSAPSLRVFRAPLSWLMAGGRGIAPLDLPASAREIRASIENGGRFKFEDDLHAAEIADAIAGLTDLRSLVVDQQVAA